MTVVTNFWAYLRPGEKILIEERYSPKPISEIDFIVEGGGGPHDTERVLSEITEAARIGTYSVRVELITVNCSSAAEKVDGRTDYYVFRRGAHLTHYYVDIGEIQISRSPAFRVPFRVPRNRK